LSTRLTVLGINLSIKKKNSRACISANPGVTGGDKQDRTADLLNAIYENLYLVASKDISSSP